MLRSLQIISAYSMVVACTVLQGSLNAHPLDRGIQEAEQNDKRIRYMEIPVIGDIGIDVVPSGLERALMRAKKAPKSNAIVIHIDSQGGIDEDAIAMGQMLKELDPSIPIVAAVRRAIGPSLALVLAADRLVILEPETSGIRIQYRPGLGMDEAEMDLEREAFLALAGDGPVKVPVVNAMFDPTLSVFIWKDVDGMPQASNRAPEDATDVHEIPPGGIADGISASEMRALGLGREAESIEDIGPLFGYADWRLRDKSGANLMRIAADERKSDESQIERRIHSGLRKTAEAMSVLASVDELESRARQEDPRRQSYQYRQDWIFGVGGFNNWVYSGPSFMAWRDNCDRAVDAWHRVVDAIDRVGALGRAANEDLVWINAQTIPTAMASWVEEEVGLLSARLDPLLSEGGMLWDRRKAAEQQAAFFAANRNNPID